MKVKSTNFKTSDEISIKITNLLKSAAQSTIPSSVSKNRGKELWKNDKEFNELLAKRQHLSKDSNDYKTVTKAVKRRIIFLKNQKLRKEADEINENATRRQVAELYTNMKDCNTIFKKLREKQSCDPQMLKDYFETHFNKSCKNVEQTDFIDAPIVIRSLCDVTDTDINTRNM